LIADNSKRTRQSYASTCAYKGAEGWSDQSDCTAGDCTDHVGTCVYRAEQRSRRHLITR
jgi:hypothetical protein